MADHDVAALLGCDLSGTKRAICTQLEQRLLRDGGAAQPPSAWSLRVAASEVTGAGEGVHLRGSCEAGTVLADLCDAARPAGRSVAELAISAPVAAALTEREAPATAAPDRQLDRAA